MINHRESRALAIAVAVIADDAAVRHSLKFSLEIEGFAVRAYANCDEMLNDPALGNFDCVIIDQSVRDMPLLAALGRLRERQMTMPAILITSRPTASLRKRAFDAGAVIVEKPLFGNTLLEHIRALIPAPPRPD